MSFEVASHYLYSKQAPHVALNSRTVGPSAVHLYTLAMIESQSLLNHLCSSMTGRYALYKDIESDIAGSTYPSNL